MEGKKIVGYNPNTGEPIYEDVQPVGVQNAVNNPSEPTNNINNINDLLKPNDGVIQPKPNNYVSVNETPVTNNVSVEPAQPVQPVTPVAPVQPVQQATPVQPQYQQPVVNQYQQPAQPQPMMNNGYNQMPVQQVKPKKTGGRKFGIFVGILMILGLLGLAGYLLLGNPTGKNSLEKQKEDKISANKNVTRTIMIYMVGSNLESESQLGTADLDAINYYKLDNDNVKVVLIAGGSNKWHNDYIDGSTTAIYELKSTGFEKVKDDGLQNMGTEKTLNTFLNYVYDNYKSDKYALIFWNHGGAIQGSEYDDKYNGDSISLTEMNDAFAASPFKNDNKLEFVLYRTCLNSTLEGASILKNYSEFLIASEEVTRGIYLYPVLGFINEIAYEDSTYDVGIKYIESYKKFVSNMKLLYDLNDLDADTIYSTYAIIDLSAIDDLVDSVNDFAADIDVKSNFNEIARVRSNMLQYGEDEPAYDTIDLYNFVNNLKDLSPTKGQKVLDNVERAVLYNWATNDSSRGISIYMPYNGETVYRNYFVNMYSDFSELGDYKNFISTFTNSLNSGTTTLSFAQNKSEVKDDKKSGKRFTLELTDEQKERYARARYLVFKKTDDGYFRIVYNGKEVDLDGNTLSATIEGKQLKAVVTEDGERFEELIPLRETDITDEFIKYEATVSLEKIEWYDAEGPFGDTYKDFNFSIDLANVDIIYNKKTGKITTGNYVLIEKNESDNDIKLPNTIIVDPNDYTDIMIASSSYKILDENGNYTEDWESNGTITGIEGSYDTFSLETEKFDDDSEYYAVFRIYDTNNNYYYSKLVKMN